MGFHLPSLKVGGRWAGVPSFSWPTEIVGQSTLISINAKLRTGSGWSEEPYSFHNMHFTLSIQIQINCSIRQTFSDVWTWLILESILAVLKGVFRCISFDSEENCILDFSWCHRLNVALIITHLDLPTWGELIHQSTNLLWLPSSMRDLSNLAHKRFSM